MKETYETVSGMIKFLAIKKVDLMTNNPKKIEALKTYGCNCKSTNSSFN